jgi:hypothetical protein
MGFIRTQYYCMPPDFVTFKIPLSNSMNIATVRTSEVVVTLASLKSSDVVQVDI